MKALVIQSTGKEYKVKTLNNRVLTCFIRGKLKQLKLKSTNPIAVGDYVEVTEPKDGSASVISKIYDRKNYLLRKSVNLSKQVQILASNIDQAIFIFTLKDPETNIVFLDRFLAIAESYSVDVHIVFNKLDILDEEELDLVGAIASMYQNISYPVSFTSAQTGEGMDEFKNLLNKGVSVLIGNSGVGKSSLIKHVDPNLKIKIGEISEHHKQGRHTTINANMYELDGGGAIIDTPGIRGIDFYKTEKEEISHYFRDIFAISKECKFNNCIHLNEPQCAVRQALEEGKLSQSRYDSYHKIITAETEEKYR